MFNVNLCGFSVNSPCRRAWTCLAHRLCFAYADAITTLPDRINLSPTPIPNRQHRRSLDASTTSPHGFSPLGFSPSTSNDFLWSSTKCADECNRRPATSCIPNPSPVKSPIKPEDSINPSALSVTEIVLSHGKVRCFLGKAHQTGDRSNTGDVASSTVPCRRRSVVARFKT